jgi:recombination associated protein RdgC
MPLFKSIVAYRIAPHWTPPAEHKLEAELQRLAFQPCGPTQERSAGWLPPRGAEFGAMVENVAGHWILKIAVEKKAVPGAAVRQELEARVKQIEAQTGRKPGKKEKRELKEEIVHTFLPRAFSKHSTHVLWLDLEQRTLVIASGSMKAAEPLVKQLVDVMAEIKHPIALAPINTATTPATAMAEWLSTKTAPQGFTIDRDLELKHAGEDRSVVKYARHSLDLDEIGQHISEGKLPTQLALTWNDKVSFVLNEQMAIRKIDIRDVEEAPKGEEAFDADAAIATAELGALLPELLEALGGELKEQPLKLAA